MNDYHEIGIEACLESSGDMNKVEIKLSLGRVGKEGGYGSFALVVGVSPWEFGREDRGIERESKLAQAKIMVRCRLCLLQSTAEAVVASS